MTEEPTMATAEEAAQRVYCSNRNYRPGHRDTNDDRDTGNINDDRDIQREITNWDTGTQMTTGTQGI